MEKIAARIGSQDLTTLTLQNSGHVIIRDREKERVFQGVAQFIQRVCEQPE
jgi:esterase/lipase